MSEITLEEALARLAKLESEAADRVKGRKVLERDKKTLGYWLYQRRCAAGMTIADLSDKSGIVSPNICRAEIDGSISIKTLKRLSNAIGCKTWEIIKDWEEQA